VNCAEISNVSCDTVPVTWTLPHAAVAAALNKLAPLTVVVQDAEVLWLAAVTTVVLGTENCALPSRRLSVAPDEVSVQIECRSDWRLPLRIAPPRPDRCRVGLRTGWLKLTVTVPSPVQVPVEGQPPVLTVTPTAVSPVAMLVGVKWVTSKPRAPRVVAPSMSVSPVEAAVTWTPPG